MERLASTDDRAIGQGDHFARLIAIIVGTLNTVLLQPVPQVVQILLQRGPLRQENVNDVGVGRHFQQQRAWQCNIDMQAEQVILLNPAK